MPLCQMFFTCFQTVEQPEVGAVRKDVEVGLGTDDDDVGATKAEDDLVEDPESEALHRLPILSPLFNVHADLSPW